MNGESEVEDVIEGDAEAPQVTAERRLWPRFSLAVTAFVLLILSQESFGILAGAFRATGRLAVLPLVVFLACGILAGLAFGLALVLPLRIRFRHPRRGLTLALLPTLITVLNVTFAFSPTGVPESLGVFAAQYLVGLQSITSVLLGFAAASVVAET